MLAMDGSRPPLALMQAKVGFSLSKDQSPKQRRASGLTLPRNDSMKRYRSRSSKSQRKPERWRLVLQPSMTPDSAR